MSDLVGSGSVPSTRAIPIVALDVADGAQAIAMVQRLGERCSFYKVGSELFTAAGPQIIERIRAESGADVFLDLKFHDIPATVAGSVRSAARLGVRLLTVHASGGRAMLQAARDSAEQVAGGACGVLGVTILTSLDDAALGEAWGRPGVVVVDEVQRLAALSAECALHGIVCSGQEAAAVRAAHGETLALLVPGIRFAGGATQDQARVMTPAAAQAAGARYLVLGRAVTGAPDPSEAMARVLSELGGAAGSGGSAAD